MDTKRNEAPGFIRGFMKTAKRVHNPQSPSKRMISPSLILRPNASDSLSAQKERGLCPPPIRDNARSRPFTEELSYGTDIVLTQIQSEVRQMTLMLTSEIRDDDKNVMRPSCLVVSAATGTYEFLVHQSVTSIEGFLR